MKRELKRLKLLSYRPMKSALLLGQRRLLYGFLQRSKFVLATGRRLSLEIVAKTMRWSFFMAYRRVQRCRARRLLLPTDSRRTSATRQVFGSRHLYGQVLKTRRNDRITKVERRQVIGSSAEFEKALEESEDSSSLNTSFIERLNLTIRQACSYLTRRTTCHARSQDHLEGQLEMVRCHYNFLRPHRALKFGRLTKTPAMQAGLATGRLSFREVFLWRLVYVIWIQFSSRTETKSPPMAMAA